MQLCIRKKEDAKTKEVYKRFSNFGIIFSIKLPNNRHEEKLDRSSASTP